MGFTINQLKAIESNNTNVLVSAAAGSGKTTVLVERIIRRVMDEQNPIDIDKMLVLTFTKAAAASMREKILKAIEDKLTDDPENAHLLKQSVLVQNARISTFHGFCQEIIKNHFYEIDADPMLRVADEGEIKLMQMDVINKVLEDAYESRDEDFIKLVESYSAGKSDKNLEDIILKIYNISQAQIKPMEYLDMCENCYNVENVADLKNSTWFLKCFRHLQEKAEMAYAIACETIRLCDMDNGPKKYRSVIEEEKSFADSLRNSHDFEEMHLLCKVHSRLKLPAITAKDLVDDELKEKVKRNRESFYKITDVISESVGLELESEVLRMQGAASLSKALIKLVRQFTNGYSQMKQESLVIDFNDMEHLAIKILSNPDGLTAKAYRDRFEQIYVDEYQDSNLTQEEIVRLISNHNVFMVGDVKQSIYRFRMARPDLFLKKYKSFTGIAANDGDINGNGVVIDLSDNFRSRLEVIDSANEIFSNIMNESLGGIEYDEKARLNYGKLYDEYLGDGYESELLLCSTEEMTKVETQASAIATRINQLVDTMDIYDEDIKGKRKLKYSDIVILLRSMTNAEAYKDVLKSFNIPSYVTVSTGYFASTEIDTLLNLLKVIDNPLQDIPLAAVLKSSIGGLTDEDLGVIRGRLETSKEEYRESFYLYDLLLAQKDNINITRFLKLLDDYRAKSEYMSVYELLREIIDGEYGDIALSTRGGSQVKANLNMLLKKAEDFGKLSYKGLFHFLRYIDQIRKYEIDYGEASLTDENDNNVKIMTIHKSKGLEFPVVFVADLSKKRNSSDERTEVIADPDIGLGLSYVDLDKRVRGNTLLKNYLVSKLKNENLAEEIRVLYVALTRAKEKLILVGAVDDPGKDFYNKNKPLDMCDSYLDLLSAAYGVENGFKNTHVIEMGFDDYVIQETLKEQDREENISRIEEIIKGDLVFEEEYDNKITRDSKRKIQDILDFEYIEKEDGMRKMSVSELKKASLEIESLEDFSEAPTLNLEDIAWEDNSTIEAYVPDFIRNDTEAPNSGTFYGTAFHRMCELWDYRISLGREEDVSIDEISAFYEKMLNERKIDSKQLESVNPREIKTFILSSASRRMGIADSKGLLYREQPFTLWKKDENLLIQGIIDAYWIEDDEIVILDYKTDRVDNKDELIKRYQIQLDYYEQALSQLLNKNVKEKIIYSTRLREAIKL